MWIDVLTQRHWVDAIHLAGGHGVDLCVARLVPFTKRGPPQRLGIDPTWNLLGDTDERIERIGE